MSREKLIRLAQFYVGMAIVAVGFFALPLPHALTFAVTTLSFLVLRAFYGLVGRVLFYVENPVTTVFGIENARIFGWMSVVMAAVTLIFLVLPVPEKLLGISYGLFLCSIDCAFHSRLQR